MRRTIIVAGMLVVLVSTGCRPVPVKHPTETRTPPVAVPTAPMTN